MTVARVGKGGGGKAGAANHASSLGSFRKHVLQHLHGVAASCANRHFRERPQKDHTFSRKTTHPARGAPPHSYCTGSTSKTKESVFCKKGPCGLFSPTYFGIFPKCSIFLKSRIILPLSPPLSPPLSRTAAVSPDFGAGQCAFF